MWYYRGSYLRRLEEVICRGGIMSDVLESMWADDVVEVDYV